MPEGNFRGLLDLARLIGQMDPAGQRFAGIMIDDFDLQLAADSGARDTPAPATMIASAATAHVAVRRQSHAFQNRRLHRKRLPVTLRVQSDRQ